MVEISKIKNDSLFAETSFFCVIPKFLPISS